MGIDFLESVLLEGLNSADDDAVAVLGLNPAGVLIRTIQQLEPGLWSVTWDTGQINGETVYVYEGERLVAMTSAKEWLFSVPDGETLVVQILDRPAPWPVRSFRGRLTAQWEREFDDVSRYSVSLSGVPVEVAAVAEYQQHTFTGLTDGNYVTLKVIAISSSGVVGTDAQGTSQLRVMCWAYEPISLTYQNGVVRAE